MPAEGNFQGAGSTCDFTPNGDQLGRGMGQWIMKNRQANSAVCALAHRAGRRHVPPWKRFRLSPNWTSPQGPATATFVRGPFFWVLGATLAPGVQP